MVTHEAMSLLTDHDLYLFNEGSHFRLYDKLGARVVTHAGTSGTYFAVWAPNGEQVSVIGDFNGWDKRSHRLSPKGQSGIWEGFFPGVAKGTLFKYHIVSRFHCYQFDKANPFSIFNETPPKTASIVWHLDYHWRDRDCMASRRQHNALDKPMATYAM